MKFFCDNCQAQYMISDEKVGPAGVRVRCKKCQHVIYVKQPEVDPGAGDKTVIAPPSEELVRRVSAPAVSGSGIFSSETPAEEQRFEAEIGQALDSVFAENGAAVSQPPDSSQSPPAEEDSPYTRDDRDDSDSERDPAAAPSAATISAHGVQASSGGPAVIDWFIAIRDEQVGPLTAEQIKDRFEVGEVGSDTLVWSAGLTDWRPLSTVQELAQMIVPRAAITRNEATTSNPRGEMPREAPASKSAPTFRPSAASALASLASMAQEEIAAAAKTAPVQPAAAMPRAEPVASPAAAHALLAEMPHAPAPAPVPVASAHAPFQPSEERPSYAAYAAPRSRTPWTRIVAIGVATVLVFCTAMGAVFWFMVIKPQREQAARFSEQLAAQLAARPKDPPPAPVPSPPPPPAPVVAAPPPTPTPVTAPLPTPSRPAAESADRRGGKGHKVAPVKAAAGETPAAAAKPAASSGSEDFLAGSGDSAIDKEFARELDGAGGADAKKGGAKHSPYIPPPPGQADLPQQLSQSDVIGVVAQHKDAFGHCVQEQKKRDPSSSGTVVMRWKIKPDGHTSDVGAAPGDYQESPLATCFKGQIVKMKFGQYRGAPMAPIQFPFNF